jgi:hypothetical protein
VDRPIHSGKMESARRRKSSIRPRNGTAPHLGGAVRPGGSTSDVVITKLANSLRNIEISIFFLISITFQGAGGC